MNRRKKAGTSRSKKNSTVDQKTYDMMIKKKGGFAKRSGRKR